MPSWYLPRRQLSALQTDSVVLAAAKAGVDSRPTRPRKIKLCIVAQAGKTTRAQFLSLLAIVKGYGRRLINFSG